MILVPIEYKFKRLIQLLITITYYDYYDLLRGRLLVLVLVLVLLVLAILTYYTPSTYTNNDDSIS